MKEFVLFCWLIEISSSTKDWINEICFRKETFEKTKKTRKSYQIKQRRRKMLRIVSVFVALFNWQRILFYRFEDLFYKYADIVSSNRIYSWFDFLSLSDVEALNEACVSFLSSTCSHYNWDQKKLIETLLKRNKCFYRSFAKHEIR